MRFSIVINTLDRAALLARTLQALEYQRWPDFDAGLNEHCESQAGGCAAR